MTIALINKLIKDSSESTQKQTKCERARTNVDTELLRGCDFKTDFV